MIAPANAPTAAPIAVTSVPAVHDPSATTEPSGDTRCAVPSGFPGFATAVITRVWHAFSPHNSSRVSLSWLVSSHPTRIWPLALAESAGLVAYHPAGARRTSSGAANPAPVPAVEGASGANGAGSKTRVTKPPPPPPRQRKRKRSGKRR